MTYEEMEKQLREKFDSSELRYELNYIFWRENREENMLKLFNKYFNQEQ